MIVFALLILTLLFVVLFFGRLAGARRALLAERWPAFLFACAAIFTLLRGSLWLGLALFVVSGLVFMLSGPRAQAAQASDDPGDQEARAILGIGANATAGEIRAAYRAKMARAHPDRGGSHSEAARLTAARDRLLKRRR